MNAVDAASIEKLKNSGCFDQDWYLSKYPDVSRLGMDAAKHFLWIGVKLGRDPSASVSNADYLQIAGSAQTAVAPSEQVPAPATVAQAVTPPLRDIRSELRNKCREVYFDGHRYLEQYPDLQGSGIDPYQHFINHGLDEGRVGAFFDEEWYLTRHSDVRSAGVPGFAHYQQDGREEGRDSKFFEIKISIQKNFSSGEKAYKTWVEEYDLPGTDSDVYKSAIKRFTYQPLVSIVMPVYKVSVKYLAQAIDSLLNQSYTNIEICVADDCSADEGITDALKAYAKKDARFRYVFRENNGNISEATNSALKLATGEFIGLMDHDDLLHENAIFWVVEALNRNREIDLIYTDEDKVDASNARFSPHFKSDFNYELLLTQNMISHFAVYRASVLRNIGGFRLGYEGSQDYDMTLRFLDSGARIVEHIPRVLYHWRAIEGSTALAVSEKSYTESASVRALRDHVERKMRKADVTTAPDLPQYFRVRFDVIGSPLVSIIIPTKDKVDLLEQCISSITAKSTYKNYEIIVIDNGSTERESFEYFKKIAAQGVSVIHDTLPFNYSRINNLGFKQAKGEHICLMNNDIEIVTPDWLEEMLSYSQWDDTGCIGARLWYPDDTLQHGGVIIGLGGVAGHSHKYLPKNQVGYFGRAALPQALSAVTAACLLVKASIYREVSGLDEGLSVAFNDVDFCLRVREAGYRNIWTPYAEMYHHESASRGTEDTPEKQARFNGEVKFMKDRWGDAMKRDPFYSPNLTHDREDFSFARSPRVASIKDVLLALE